MRNANALTKEMAKSFMDLKRGKVDPKIMKELSNASGKIMNICKVQVMYAVARKEEPDIPFLTK